MRQTRLIWFALGAVASLISVFIAIQIDPTSDENTTVFRTVFAPNIIPPGGKLEGTDNVAFAAGQAIRNCGVMAFSVDLSDLHGLTYNIEIKKDNIRSLYCIEDKVREVDTEIELGFKVI